MQTDKERCNECGFNWTISQFDAIEIVASSVKKFRTAFDGGGLDELQSSSTWSPAQYLWHVVDVIRYGTERLLALDLDSDSGAMTWDADEAMHLRRHSPMSVTVGLVALDLAVAQWKVLAASVSDQKRIHHPEFGTMDVVFMCRRNAHEVVHHAWDVQRLLQS